MKLKKYIAYFEDNQGIFKCAVAAKDKKEVRKYMKINGNVIKIKDVTKKFPISIEKVDAVLHQADFNEFEIEFILGALRKTNICDC